MRLPHASSARVPKKKIRHYLLDLEHPQGGTKAAFFLQFGFHADRSGDLEQALRDIALFGHVVETVPVPHGTKYVVDGETMTPSGRRIALRTVWIVLVEHGGPRFVMAYPAPRSGT